MSAVVPVSFMGVVTAMMNERCSQKPSKNYWDLPPWPPFLRGRGESRRPIFALCMVLTCEKRMLLRLSQWRSEFLDGFSELCRIVGETIELYEREGRPLPLPQGDKSTQKRDVNRERRDVSQ